MKWVVGVGTAVLVLFALAAMLLPQCVLEGERVDTPRGARAVEDLREGDAVLTRGPSGRIETGWIVGRRESTSRAWREIALEGGGRLRVTAEHPVSTSRGWVKAGRLKTGDRVHVRDGERTVVAVHARSGRARVFDLTVEPNPNFFASGVLVHNKSTQRASNQRNAAWGLKSLARAQADFHENDRDGNQARDFWARDVAGLYYLRPPGQEDAIKLIEGSIANADECPARETRGPELELLRGYYYRALTYYEDEAGKKIPYDAGTGRNPSRFGFAAFPAGRLVETQPTFIISEAGTIYRKNLEGLRIDTFPQDPLKAGWSMRD
jgi:hypothetical protein